MLGKRSWFISSEFRFNVYGKFRGLWTKKKFFGKHETSLCIKSEKRLWIPNDDMIACLKSQKLTEYRCVWPYGTLKQIECSSGRIVQDVWTQHISPTTIRAHNTPAIAGQRTGKLLLVLNDAHNSINNPTVQIADPRKQNTLLPGNSTTDRRPISHRDGDICSYRNHAPF